MRTNRFTTLVALLATTMIVGCGSTGLDTHPVSGKVTFDGQPVPEGRILFRAVGGDPRAFSAEIKDGLYQLEAFSGKMTVEITASRPVPGKFDESNPGEKVPVGEMYIPARYNSRTELTADVATGKNQFDFSLTNDG
jgi:hypothetical protein